MAQPDFTNLFDVNVLLDIQRKNILAFSQAHLLACEGLQAVAQRQTAFLSQIAQDNSSLAKAFLLDGTPEEKLARHADLIKKNYENSVANWREVTAMISESGKEASDIINHRVAASLTELKSTLDKNAVNGKSSAQKKAA
jgi:phasin family protein